MPKYARSRVWLGTIMIFRVFVRHSERNPSFLLSFRSPSRVSFQQRRVTAWKVTRHTTDRRRDRLQRKQWFAQISYNSMVIVFVTNLPSNL